MKINFTSKTIEVTKTFANKASRFGSEEYMMLLTATQDLPEFEVVIKVAPVRRRRYMSGLTYEYMESYIATIDKDGSLMNDFQTLRHGYNYGVVKKWFMTVLPEFNNFAA